MNWKQNKILFNHIANKKYIIKKNINTNNILYIKWENFEIKCKYFLAFSTDDKNNIIWSCDNPFIDQKTKYLSNIIKKKLSNIKIFDIELLNKIKKIIQSDMYIIYDDEKIYFLWCLIGNYKDFAQFYIITDILSL